MTRRSLATLSLTAGLLASCTKGPDPVVVDPKHYKVAFENDRVRVLRTMIGPHEKTPLHYHPESVLIVLTADRGREILENGKTTDVDNVLGAGVTAAGIHAVENLSDTPMERYVVELRRR
jgi:hypothetical protein